MYKYKILYDNLSGQYSVLRNSDNTQFLKDSGDNIDYQQFLEDAKTIGITTCVEGPTVGVTTAYNVARQAEYPSIVDQLDKIYHGGVDAWKADIKAIKDKYPKTQVGVTTVAAVPSWVQTEVNVLIKNDYLQAVERLKEPRIKLGTPYIESVWNGSNYEDQTKYKDVPAAANPAVVRDEAERDAAQAVIDDTPQSIIDSINT
tara:strand:- start:52 stop:657 length:606 start_codon:yes stop_codon:yes gene_type:complete